MFDAQCDLAALVYDDHDDPDAVLRDFAVQLNAHGFRAVGAKAMRRGANSGNRLRNHQISCLPSGTVPAIAVPHAYESDGLSRASL